MSWRSAFRTGGRAFLWACLIRGHRWVETPMIVDGPWCSNEACAHCGMRKWWLQ